MGSTVASQLTIFLFSAILGAALGVIYDIIGVFNAVIKENLARIFVQDVLYFIVSAVITFMYMLVTNGGEIRIYIVVGEAVGWLIYRATVGKFIYKIVLKVVEFAIKIVRIFKNYAVSKLPKGKIIKVKSAVTDKLKVIKAVALKKVFWIKPPKKKKSNKNKGKLK